jgi:glycosyltransferase involved in cell wall biosynthesis
VTARLKVDIWHNIVWSKYKGEVFSSLHKLAAHADADLRFFHIADTERDRVGLAAIDLSYHRYPFERLFPGPYEEVPLWRRVTQLVRKVVASDADLIVLPGYHRLEFWAMLAACLLSGRPRAVFCDSTAYDRPQRWLRSLAKRFFFSHCHGYFAYGQRSREYLLAHSAHAEAIFVRCQAAALPHAFTFEGARSERLRLAAPGAAPRFLYVGRLAREKGLEVLLEAFARVRARLPQATLALAGAGPLEGPLRAGCETRGLGAAVAFLGSMAPEALGDQYLRASCLVLPSLSEPWGLVVNEALSYGCPVVVSQICGCVPELVLDGVTGYAFPAGDADQLARRLEDALALGPVATVADACQELILGFTPDYAAIQILNGCYVVVQQRRERRP